MMKVANTEASREGYGYKFKKFMKFCNENDIVSDKENFEELLDFNEEKITDLLIDYIDWRKSNGNTYRTISTALAPVEAFFEMNRKSFHKKVVRRSNSKGSTKNGTSIPATDEDVFAMINYAKGYRNKFLIAFLASTGIRPASLVDPVLRMKHLVPLPDIADLYQSGFDNPAFKLNSRREFKRYCYGIKVYEDSDEGYWVFLTPEASDLLDSYLDSRKRNGEELTDESPILATYTKKNDSGKAEKASKNTKYDFFTDDNMDFFLKRVIKGARIERKKINSRNYDKAITYMFRKRYNGHLKMTNQVNSNIAEKLMAHKRGLDGTYLQPTMEQCYVEFFKAILKLTIDPHQRHELETAIQQKKIDELKSEKQRHAEETRSNFIKWFMEMKPQQIEKLMERKVEILNS